MTDEAAGPSRAAAKRMRAIRNLGIMAHIDAGKTTVTERLLFAAGRTHKMGEVHEGQAVMDWMELERERGITITAAVTSLAWRGHELHLIDTPGHVDFTIEVERSLRVLDGAVAVFDAAHGVEPQSEAVWRQADRWHVPRLAFANKMDRVGADLDATLASMRARFPGHAIASVQRPLGVEAAFTGFEDLVARRTVRFPDGDDPRAFTAEPGLSPAGEADRRVLLETLADHDDAAAEAVLTDRDLDEPELREAIRRAVLGGRFVPLLCGSALHNKGIPQLLDAVCDWLPSPLDVPLPVGTTPAGAPGDGSASKAGAPGDGAASKAGAAGDGSGSKADGAASKAAAPGDGAARTADEAGPLLALAFKVSLLDERRRFVFLRLYAGRLAEGDEVWNGSLGRAERVARILLMHAAQKTRVAQAAAGQIVAVMGLKETRTGDTLCDRAHPVVLERLGAYAPVISQAIEAGAQAEREPLLEALARVGDEDPTFTFGDDPETGQLLVSGMGELHLEVVAERLRREFGLTVRLGRPQVVLRETVSAVGEAEATFERVVEDAPVWAQVAVRVAPRPRGAGLSIEVDPALAALPFARPEVLDFMRAGAREAAEAGVLEGHPLQDLQVTLRGAAWRDGASRPFAYKVATATAVRDAAARAAPVLLEPVAALTVVTPAEHLGDVIGGVDRRGGTILDVAERGAAAREVRAEAPLRRLFGYATDLRSATQGRAVFTLRFDRFDVAAR